VVFRTINASAKPSRPSPKSENAATRPSFSPRKLRCRQSSIDALTRLNEDLTLRLETTRSHERPHSPARHETRSAVSRAQGPPEERLCLRGGESALSEDAIPLSAGGIPHVRHFIVVVRTEAATLTGYMAILLQSLFLNHAVYEPRQHSVGEKEAASRLLRSLHFRD
jgi:hypothetical protein